MKGLEMPVNTLVVIAIAVLVMLGMIAMYMAGSGGGTIIAETAAKSSACNDLVQRGCADANIDTVSIDWAQYGSLGAYCEAKYIEAFINDETKVKTEDETDANGNDVFGVADTADMDLYCRTVICGCPGIA
jgi:hypothetical protein